MPLQRKDFIRILEAMDGLPVTIRLIDPPLHEFLPDFTELSVRVALAEARGESIEADRRLLHAVSRLHEQNPMLGLRGVRLGLVLPGLFALQVRAIAEAACLRQKLGGDPQAEIMIPLVGSIQELELVTDEAAGVLAEVAEANGCTLRFPIGTMIELPRAALTAGQIAEAAEFFSFGTNDLTQTTWGFSRDDVEAAFFSAYLEKGVFGVSPFESIDREGVGELVRIAVEKGRATRPDLHCGVCGEHGGDPESIHFFEEVGLDYVSCSPFRVPVARLEAGRAIVARQTMSPAPSAGPQPRWTTPTSPTPPGAASAPTSDKRTPNPAELPFWGQLGRIRGAFGAGGVATRWRALRPPACGRPLPVDAPCLWTTWTKGIGTCKVGECSVMPRLSRRSTRSSTWPVPV